MSLLHSRQQRFEAVAQASAAEMVVFATRRPAVWRRVLAGALDRCLPLPLLAFFFPKWTLVVLAYHLLCDCAPERRSVGKWVCRLRVVANAPAGKCVWWRAVLRRVGPALAQAAWCSWEFLPFVLAYELIALACVLLSKEGKRPEDWLAGTRVVTEKVYRQKRQRATPEFNRR